MTIAYPVIKTFFKNTASDSTSRATLVTPTSGKKIRVISIQCANSSAATAIFEVYFDTGTTIASDATKAIFVTMLLTGTQLHDGMVWSPGSGPLGDVNDVVSIRTSADVGTSGWFVIVYREE